MANTVYIGAPGDENLASAPPARFLGGAKLAAVLAIIAFFLSGLPAAQAQTPGSTRLELVTVSGRDIYHRWSDNNGTSWSSWTGLGRPQGQYGLYPLLGSPAVVSDGPARLTVIAVSDWRTVTDGNPLDGPPYYLWQKTFAQGSWSAWTRVPGTDPTGYIHDNWGWKSWGPSSSPAVVSSGPNRMDMFLLARANDGWEALLHTWAVYGAWSGEWEVVTAAAAYGVFSAPAATSWGPGRFDVFFNYENSLYHSWFENGRWYPSSTTGKDAEPLGGYLTSPPAAASPGSGLLSIYARGGDGHLWGINFNGGWSSWYEVGCCLGGDVTNSVAAVAQGLVEMDVYVTGTLHDFYRKRYIFAAQGWTDWQYLDHTFDYTNIATTTWVPIPPNSGGDPGCRHC